MCWQHAAQANLGRPQRRNLRTWANLPVQHNKSGWFDLQGCSFDEVCEMTTIFEGSIIRAVRRLEELLNQLSSAAKVLPRRILPEDIPCRTQLAAFQRIATV